MYFFEKFYHFFHAPTSLPSFPPPFQLFSTFFTLPACSPSSFNMYLARFVHANTTFPQESHASQVRVTSLTRTTTTTTKPSTAATTCTSEVGVILALQTPSQLT
jgi:hypothetical protein